MGIILVERTTISDEAVQYVQEIESKFKGEISRGHMKQDYLTAPWEEPWKKGRSDCFQHNLIEKADDGSEFSYIRYKITERGYKVLKKAKKK